MPLSSPPFAGRPTCRALVSRLGLLAGLLVALAGTTSARPSSALLDLRVAAAAPVPGTPLQADDAGLLGYAVSLSRDRVIVGAPFSDGKRGAAYVYRQSATGWVQEARLMASDAALDDAFGISVAIDGDRALVGAYRHGGERGAAYVFRRAEGGWVQEAALDLPLDAGDQFGVSVALYGDRALVGAHGRGAAYVFRRTVGTWALEAELSAPGAGADGAFGWSVALWGDRALVGARQSDGGRGAAFAFRTVDGAWALDGHLQGSDSGAADNFGVSVALWGDQALIGSPFSDGRRGAAYAFRSTGDGWAQEAKLTAADAADDDWFGWSVALSTGRALVGSRLDDDGGSNSGGAYLFAREGAEWTVEAKLSEGAQSGDHFGLAVSLSGDRALIGAPYNSRGLGTTHVVSLAPHASACVPGAPLSVVSYDAIGQSARGETIEIANGPGTAVDLTGCSLVAIDPYSRTVTYSVPTTGTVPAGGAFTFATSGGDQSLAAHSIPDGPGAFALVHGSAAAGDAVSALLGRLVVAVAYQGSDEVGRVGGTGTGDAETFEAALVSLVVTPTGATTDVDLSVTAAPNPVASRSTIAFGIATAADVRVSVYDALGREVAVLAEAEYRPGRHEIALTADGLSAGVYTVRVVSGTTAHAARITVSR